MPIEKRRDFLSAIKLAAFILSIMGSGLSISLCGAGIVLYLIALVLEAVFCGGHKPPVAMPPWILAAPLLISWGLSLALSTSHMESWSGLNKNLQGIVLAYAALDAVRDRRALLWAAAAAVLTFAASAADGVWQHFAGLDLIRHAPPMRREIDIINGVIVPKVTSVTGPLKHSNDYGTFLAPGIALAFILALEALRAKKRAAAAFLAAAAAVGAAALFWTMSRGALISLLAAAIVFCVIRRHWRFVALCFAAAALVVIVPSPVSGRLQELLHPSAGTNPERLLLMKTAWRMACAAPWFGLGLNTYSVNFPAFRPPDYHDAMYAHNSFLQMASEAGFVGLFFYLAFVKSWLWWAATRIWKARDSFVTALAAALFAGVSGFLVNALFESSLQSTQLRTLFWAWTGLLAAAARVCAAQDGEKTN